MKSSLFVIALPALVCGVAIGWVLHPSPAPAEKEEIPDLPRAVKRVDDAGDLSAREALRRRVKELEREIAALRAKPPEMPELSAGQPTGEVARARSPHRQGPPSAADFRARMEEMRKNDPERYTHMTNNMARFRALGLRRAETRLGTLASVDTSRMTRKQLEVHEKLQDLIAREQELHEIARHDNEETTDDERAAAWTELRELMREKHVLENAERETLLTMTAESYGVSGDDAKELVDTIKAVYQSTQSGFGPPRGRGGFGGRGR